MIEINLVPDVKQELLKAQRVRTSVISMAILVSLVVAGIVVALLVWVFAVQSARGAISDNTIKTENAKLVAVADIENTLTIQNQLASLSTMHDDKNITSRVFDVISTINPAAPNNVSVTNLSLDVDTKTIKIEAQAVNGYPALEVFKKTLSATTFTYTVDNEAKSVPLAADINDSERSYGEDASGARVLRFTMLFTYPDELFSRTSKNARLVAPTKSNATDSYLGVPDSLFGAKASDVGGDK